MKKAYNVQKGEIYITSDEYKIYDMELFRSHLKVFHSQNNKQQHQNNQINIQDQSLTLQEHLPITLEASKQEHRNFSINQSFEGITEENMPTQKKQITRIDSKQYVEKASNNHEMIVNDNQSEKQSLNKYQACEFLQKKCSNPRFERVNYLHSSEIVSQLQILSKERSKYKQENYFSNQQRSIQVKSIQDIFENYRNNNFTIKYDKEESIKEAAAPNLPINTETSTPPSPFDKLQAKTSIQKKKCQFCQIAKQKVQRLKASKIITPQQQFVPKKWFVGTQPRIKKINLSPNRLAVNKYFEGEDKNQYMSEFSSFAFKGQVPLKEEYFEEDRLRDQYLKSAKLRSQQIQKQLDELKFPSQFKAEKYSSRSNSRKKIFTLNIEVQEPPTNIKQQERKQTILETPKKIKQIIGNRPPIYKNIFGSKLEEDRLTACKRNSNSVDFNYVKQSLVNTRIHIFNSKSRQKEGKVNSKGKIFKRSPKHTSPRKQEIIHNFNVLVMNCQVRQWFQRNQKQIIVQADRINSYQLITRYISQSEIQVRLNQFVNGMIQPKRWILLMVDGVYARLKDRYLPN